MERLDMTLADAGFATSLYFIFRTVGCFLGAFILQKVFCEVFLWNLSVVLYVGGNGGIIYIPFGNNYLYLHCHDWFR